MISLCARRRPTFHSARTAQAARTAHEAPGTERTRKGISSGLASWHACAVALACVALGALPSAAQAQTTVTGVRTQGNGCPGGSVSVLTSGDQAAILFNGFQTQVGPEGRPASSVNCNVTLQVEMEEGSNLSGVDVLWQGVVALAEGSTGTFSRGVTFPGAPAVRRSEVFREPFNAFALLDEVRGFAPGGCAARRLAVRMNAGLMLRGQGSAEVSSADAGASSFDTVRLRFGLQGCSGGPGGARPTPPRGIHPPRERGRPGRPPLGPGPRMGRGPRPGPGPQFAPGPGFDPRTRGEFPNRGRRGGPRG